jgi:hypothetical protein
VLGRGPYSLFIKLKGFKNSMFEGVPDRNKTMHIAHQSAV